METGSGYLAFPMQITVNCSDLHRNSEGKLCAQTSRGVVGRLGRPFVLTSAVTLPFTLSPCLQIPIPPGLRIRAKNVKNC